MRRKRRGGVGQEKEEEKKGGIVEGWSKQINNNKFCRNNHFAPDLHRVMPYGCDICEKNFSTLFNMQRYKNNARKRLDQLLCNIR